MRVGWSAAALPLLLVAVVASCGRTAAPAGPPPPIGVGRVSVHPGRVTGAVSPLVFGAGIEWTESGNRVFDASRGLARPEIVAALLPLRLPVLRFPGGILADHYHWRDGVGPRTNRPKRRSPMDGAEHANDFGTDEFVDLCRQLGSEPLVTANAGTGSLEEVLSWQRYFRDHGFPARYWEIGNEIYLAEPKARASIPGNDERIYKTAAQYAELFERWAAAIKSQDGAAMVGAIAGTYNTSSDNRGWLDTLLRLTGARMDFLALHDSFAPLIFRRYDYSHTERREEAYRAMFAAAAYTEEDLQAVGDALRAAGAPVVRLAVTEHFPLFGAGDHDQLMASLDQSRTLASALYTASLFNVYVRRQVWMANYNLVLSRWFGALLTDADAGLVRTPTYHVWDLYRNHLGDQAVAVEVSSETFDTRAIGAIAARKGVPWLDAIATRGPHGTLALSVVNRSLSQAVPAVVEVDGVRAGATAAVLTLGGPSAHAINGESLTPTTEGGALDNVRIEAKKWTTTVKPYSFPPHSVTVMTWAHR
jgi:alpha-N-arabinofuranosidase